IYQPFRLRYIYTHPRYFSIYQYLKMAIARCIPSYQASKLKRRLQQVQSGSLTGPGNESQAPGNLRNAVQTQGPPPDSTKLDSLYMIADSVRLANEQLKDKIFGYNLFNNSDISFEPVLNIPTPTDYQLGPGDEIIIDIWGAAQMNYQLNITPGGMVNIPNIGPINVNGLT